VSTDNCNGKSILVFWTLDFPGAKVSDPLDKCRCSTLCHHLSEQQVVIKKVYLSLFFVTFKKLACNDPEHEHLLRSGFILKFIDELRLWPLV
jgi:hypothetical protein